MQNEAEQGEAHRNLHEGKETERGMRVPCSPRGSGHCSSSFETVNDPRTVKLHMLVTVFPSHSLFGQEEEPAVVGFPQVVDNVPCQTLDFR